MAYRRMKKFFKRRYKRRYGGRRIPRSIKSRHSGQRPMHFKRTFEESNLVSGVGLFFRGVGFKLNLLSDVTDFTNLFDTYKVKCIVYRIWAGWDSNDAGGTAAPLLGYLHYVHDYNDSNSPASLTEMYSYANYKCVALSRCQGYKIVLYPKVSSMFYKSVTTTGYG